MTNVIVCSAAETDFTESLVWYAERSVETANDFDAECDRALAEIATYPGRFPFSDKRHQFFLMRRFPFRIIYRVANENVLIVAVAHGSRAPDYWANR